MTFGLFNINQSESLRHSQQVRRWQLGFVLGPSFGGID